jgi:hypothetical protein
MSDRSYANHASMVPLCQCVTFALAGIEALGARMLEGELVDRKSIERAVRGSRADHRRV